jgi:hypothetical protein
MAVDAYLQIEGIKGESMDDKHKEWIECLDVDFGVDQPRSPVVSTAGGHTSARAEFDDVVAVYDAAGKARWKGYAGITAKVDGIDSVISTFDHPKWNEQGELTARFVCTSSKAHGVLTLSRAPSGDLSWRGHMKCS